MEGLALHPIQRRTGFTPCLQLPFDGGPRQSRRVQRRGSPRPRSHGLINGVPIDEHRRKSGRNVIPAMGRYRVLGSKTAQVLLMRVPVLPDGRHQLRGVTAPTNPRHGLGPPHLGEEGLLGPMGPTDVRLASFLGADRIRPEC